MAYEAPVIEHDDWNDTDDRVHLFTITRPGKTPRSKPIRTEYSIPNKPHAGLALGFMKMAREHGTTIALFWLLEQAVGEAGYMALAAEPKVGIPELQAIALKVQDVVLGGLNAPKD